MTEPTKGCLAKDLRWMADQGTTTGPELARIMADIIERVERLEAVSREAVAFTRILELLNAQPPEKQRRFLFAAAGFLGMDLSGLDSDSRTER